MKAILIGIFALVLSLSIVLLGWYYYLRSRLKRSIAKKYDAFAPLAEKLERRQTISKSEVEVIVQNAALRHATYRALEAYDRLDLFPSNFLTLEKGAESFLVTWLEFPTELGRAPHEIELSATISLDGILSLTYLVFRYRMEGKHWATPYNWMFGVVGPYHPLSKAYDVPAKIFSRFNGINLTTPEAEARWVHEHI